MDAVTANARKEARDAFGRAFVPGALIMSCGIALNVFVKGSIVIPMASLALLAIGACVGIVLGLRKRQEVLARAGIH